MEVKLPIQTKEFKNGEVIRHKEYKIFDIDTTLASQIRFESKFPELAEQGDLYDYSNRILKVKKLSAAKILSELKLLYCWIDTNIEFIEFVKLFDFTDEKYIEELITTLTKAFEDIINSSAEKN